MTQPKFISFEGGEGCGKSTQTQLLADTFRQRGIQHITTREPGGSVLAEQLRTLLVQPQEQEWLPESEMLLFMAARVEHVRTVIQPALAQGKWVLCDRFHDSTRIYQGIVKGLGIAYYDTLHHLMLGDVRPDVTFLLDIDVSRGLARAASRHDNDTRFEAYGKAFHQRLRNGFLALAKAEPQRITALNADRSPEAIHADILSALNL